MKMEKEIKGKVIKPPISKVTSGKVFKPSKAFLHKEWTKGVVAAAAIWLGTLVGFVLLAYFLAYVEPVDYPSAALLINTWIGPINYGMIMLNLIWLIPALIIQPFYINSIEYSVKAESGETMPNIASKAGAFDRMFGIGSVNIETAGYSGSNQTGPEEKLEGIVFYEEVRDFILNELRRFRAPYVTGTEVVLPVEEPVPRGPGLDDEMLITLREIRDLLRGKNSPG